jgi:hypothetical protein
MLFEKLAGIREFHTTSATLKKISPAPLLELAYVERNGRLAQVKNFGGSRKIFQTRALEKDFEPVRVHSLEYILFFFISLRQLLKTLISKSGFYIGQQLAFPNK